MMGLRQKRGLNFLLWEEGHGEEEKSFLAGDIGQ